MFLQLPYINHNFILVYPLLNTLEFPMDGKHDMLVYVYTEINLMFHPVNVITKTNISRLEYMSFTRYI